MITERQKDVTVGICSEGQFYEAIQSILGEEFKSIEKGVDNIPYWCSIVAQKYFIDDIDTPYFQDDMDIIKYTARNLSKNGVHGLV